MTTEPRYTLTGVKTFRGREGYGFNATLHCNGRKVALVMDDASGALHSRFEWLAKDAATRNADEAALDAYAATLPDEVLDCSDIRNGPESVTMEMDASRVVDQLVDAWENEKSARAKLRKLLKTSVLVSVDGGLRQVKRPPCAAFYDVVRKAYAGAKVLNEMAFDDALALFLAPRA